MGTAGETSVVSTSWGEGILSRRGVLRSEDAETEAIAMRAKTKGDAVETKS